MPNRPSIVLIGGGVRSGKSAFALARAKRLGRKRAFVATAQAFDDEMRARIGAHQAERGDEFDTLEVPHNVAANLRSMDRFDVVVVDCVTLLLSNWLLGAEPAQDVLESVLELRAAAASCHATVIFVSNEVGMGIVPESALGREFRDLSGRANQLIGEQADELYFAVFGQMLQLKPGPVRICDWA